VDTTVELTLYRFKQTRSFQGGIEEFNPVEGGPDLVIKSAKGENETILL
jgi:hypothetical protein